MGLNLAASHNDAPGTSARDRLKERKPWLYQMGTVLSVACFDAGYEACPATTDELEAVLTQLLWRTRESSTASRTSSGTSPESSATALAVRLYQGEQPPATVSGNDGLACSSVGLLSGSFQARLRMAAAKTNNMSRRCEGPSRSGPKSQEGAMNQVPFALLLGLALAGQNGTSSPAQEPAGDGGDEATAASEASAPASPTLEALNEHDDQLRPCLLGAREVLQKSVAMSTASAEGRHDDVARLQGEVGTLQNQLKDCQKVKSRILAELRDAGASDEEIEAAWAAYVASLDEEGDGSSKDDRE